MFTLIVIIFILIFLYAKYFYSFWERKGFPFIPARFPLGSVGIMTFNEHASQYFHRHYQNFKNKAPAFGFYCIMQVGLAVIDPELIKDVYARNFDSFHDRGFYYNEKSDPLSVHLFTLGGHEWKKLRTKLTSTFTSGRMKMMFPIIFKSADRLIEYLIPFSERNNPLEIKEIYEGFTSEVIASTALGLEIECLGNPQNEFKDIAKNIFQPNKWEALRGFFIFSFPKVAKILNMSFTPKKTREFFMGVIREAIEYREKNNVQRNDFLQLLINLTGTEDELTLNEIAANCFIFFFAGYETSSSAMTFISYELSINQNIQDRLRNEINQILAKYNNEITYESIAEMKYLDMVFSESMRKYPIADRQIRKSVKDFAIPNTKLIIPAGTGIVVPVYSIHHDDKYWENPEKFDPERFTEENVRTRLPYTYIPFSEGPRQCIGLRFGTMQTKLGMIKILRNFKILPSEKTQVPLILSSGPGFMTPKGGLWIKLERVK